MEKILRTLESIKLPSLSSNEINIPGQLQSAVVAAGDSVKTKKKERISHCLAVTDAVCTSSVQSLADYPKLLESLSEALFILCNDPDSDIRLVATDCLNRIIRTLKDQLLHRFQMEIYREIKRNQSPRSLRTALNLFAYMSPFIRPQKCRAFMQSLLPCFSTIAKRHEDLLYESLPGSFTKIFQNLGTFLNDEEIKSLCKDFLLNLESKSTIVRRSSATILVLICQHSRKPNVFLPKLLQQITDLLMPNVMQKKTTIIIGVLLCIRQCLPPIYDYLKTNFQVRCLEQQFLLGNIVKLYEICMMLCNHDDHNVITTSLETLLLLLTSPPDQITMRLICGHGLPGSFDVEGITTGMGVRAGARDEIYENIANIKLKSLAAKSNLFADTSSVSLEGDSDVLNFILHPDSVTTSVSEPQDDFDIEASISSSGRNSDIFIMANTSETETENGEVLAPVSDEESNIANKSSPVIENIPEIFIGSLYERRIPLYYCSRFLAYNFLLSGRKGHLRHDSESRISIKVLATNCLNNIILLKPEVFHLSLRDIPAGDLDPAEQEQFIYDVCLYITHPDPLLRGCIYTLTGSVIQIVLLHSLGTFDKYPIQLAILISNLQKGLNDPSNVGVRCAIGAISACLELLWRSKDGMEFAEGLLVSLFECLDNSYWLIKVDLVEAFSSIKWDSVVDRQDTKHTILDILLDMLTDEDARVRGATVSSLIRFVENCGRSRNWNMGNLHALCEKCVINAIHQNPVKCPAYDYPNDELRLWLEILVNQMLPLLIGLENKHAIAGYYAALAALSEKYPPELYKAIWRCENEASEIPLLFALTIDYVRSSFVVADLLVHQNLLTLSTNLFIGRITSTPSKEAEEDSFFTSCGKQLSDYGMQLLYHSITLLKLYHTTIKNSTDSAQSKKPLLSPLSSPGRKTFKVDGDKKPTEPEVVKKGENDMFQGYNFSTGLALCSTHFEKISEAVYQSWKIYKSNLDTTIEYKFTSLLIAALNTLGEVCYYLKNDYKNLPHLIEDVLGMTSTIFHICPIPTLRCIRKMLQCLFYAKVDTQTQKEYILSPYASVESFLAFWDDYQHLPRIEAKPLYDVKLLGNYIRPFEPIVITGLKMYTTSTDVNIQAEVLSLLSDLINGHVNYAHVDSNQIFLGFVIKQIGFLEEGHIRNPVPMISRMFDFLALLSKEEMRTKKFIDMDKILSLCESLLASGQPPSTHCIPALKPVIFSLFIEPTKYSISSLEKKSLESQRELAFSILIKLASCPEALPLILMVMQSRKGETDSKFLGECRTLINELLQSVAKSQLVLNDRIQYECFIAILFSVNELALASSESLFDEMKDSMKLENVDVHDFTSWASTVTSKCLILVRKYRNGEEIYFPLTFIVELLEKFVSDFMKAFPITCPFLAELGTTLVVVFLQCARIFINLGENESLKLDFIKENKFTMYNLANAIVQLNVIHPVLRKELVKFLCSLDNDDEYLWQLAFSFWQSRKVSCEFMIPAIISILKELETNPNPSLVNYILKQCPELITWLSFSKLVTAFIRNLNEKQSKLLWNQFLLVASADGSFPQTAIKNILQIIGNLNIPITKESAILCLKFIWRSEIPYLSLQVSQYACRAFKQIQLENFKFDDNELEIVKRFITTNTNTLNFPRLVSLAKKSVAICEEREEWLIFEPDELQHFATKPVSSWCCSDISWSEGPALAKMLGALSYDQILAIFNNSAFNTIVLPHAFRYVQYLLLQDSMAINDGIILMTNDKRADLKQKWSLGVASFDYIMETLEKMELAIISSHLFAKEILRFETGDFDMVLEVISADKMFHVWASLYEILKLKSIIIKESVDENQLSNNFISPMIFTFSFLYTRVQSINSSGISNDMLQGFLDFAAIALEDSSFLHCFNVRDSPTRIFCCILALGVILRKFIVKFNMTYVCSQCDEAWSDMNDYCVEVLRVFHYLTDFISQVRRGQIWMEPRLFKSLMSVVRGLARCDLVNSWILISHMGWKPQVITKSDIFPPIQHIPLEILQNEKELLLKYVFKLNVFGIASKLQFEENWMNFLSVINSYGDEHFQNQIIVVGLRALNMMLEHSIHVKYITDVLVRKFVNGLAHVDLVLAEFEPEMCIKYKLPQLTSEHSKVFENKFNIDINSCVRFLIDLFTQWLQNSQNKLPLILLTGVVETVVNISKYFDDNQNYMWMFDTFMGLFRSLEKEDEIIWDHLIYGIFLSASYLNLNAEALGGLVTILEDSLASPFINISNVALKSALVFLQSNPNCLPIINAVTPFLLKNTELHESELQSESRNYCLWELVLFIWVHGPTGEDRIEFEKELLGNIFTILSPLKKCLVSVRLLLLKYLKRIVEMNVLRPEIKRKITRLAIEVLKTPNLAIFFDSLKLYLSIFYVDFKHMYDIPNPDPEIMMQMAERCETLFQIVKSGKRFNALVVSKVLPLVVRDFLPPFEILNRVIAEFLSPQQNSPELVAPAVAQVFDKARRQPQEVALVREWIIASLPNFLSSTDISRTIWSLTFFFVGISNVPSVYNLLPFAELKRHSLQTRKLFVHASLDFYGSLGVNDKENFLALLRKGPFQSNEESPKSPYSFLLDLMSGLHCQ